MHDFLAFHGSGNDTLQSGVEVAHGLGGRIPDDLAAVGAPGSQSTPAPQGIAFAKPL